MRTRFCPYTGRCWSEKTRISAYFTKCYICIFSYIIFLVAFKRKFNTLVILVIVYVRSRSRLQDVFCKKGALKNFAKCTRKHLCQSLFFNKSAGLRPATLLKKRLWYRCFPVNFAKFSRTPFLRNTPVVASIDHKEYILIIKAETLQIH